MTNVPFMLAPPPLAAGSAFLSTLADIFDRLGAGIISLDAADRELDQAHADFAKQWGDAKTALLAQRAATDARIARLPKAAVQP